MFLYFFLKKTTKYFGSLKNCYIFVQNFKLTNY